MFTITVMSTSALPCPPPRKGGGISFLTHGQRTDMTQCDWFCGSCLLLLNIEVGFSPSGSYCVPVYGAL